MTDSIDMNEILSGIESAINEVAADEPQEELDSTEVDNEVTESADESEAEAKGESTEESNEDPEVAKAREKGWRPKEEFSGEGDWIDAAEFNRRQPLYDRLSKQNKELKDVKKTLDSVVKYQKEQETKIREKVIAELEEKRREAVRYSDTEAFDQAEAELKQVREEKGLEVEVADEPQEAQQPKIPDFVQKFAKENPWFDDASGNADPDMQAVMLRKVEATVSSGKTFEEAIPIALAHVKSVFPSKFVNPNKSKPSTVMGKSHEQRPTGKSMADLTPEQRDVWRFYKSQKIMTEKEFLKSLEA